MKKNRDDLKALYIQIRNDDVTREEEFQEFVRFSELNESQIDVLNLFDRPVFSRELADDYDVVFVGGSSDVNISDDEDYPFFESAKALLMHCVDKEIPVFASCYGFHLIVEAMGGKVESNKEYSELEGSAVISLTDEGKSDVLLSDMEDGFRAVAIHKDSVVKVPDGVTLLAETASCPYHALKVTGKPFYAFQFHPEIDKADLVARIERYQERYLDGDDALKRVIDNTVEMDSVNGLLAKFIDRVVLGDE